jgi:Predicted xylanase/chitin deacetylase
MNYSRLILFVFAPILLVIFIISYFYFLCPVFLWLSAFLIIFVFVFSSFDIASGVYLRTLCQGSADSRRIAITFDDSPKEITPRILDILKEFDVQVAFFCIGKNITGREAMLKRMVDEGHIIGNHSYSHSNTFDFQNSGRMFKELKLTDDLIWQATGKRVHLFRPPFGVTNPPLKKAVKQMGYQTIGWSIRSLDTVIHNKHKILKRITRKLKPGKVVLLHEIHPDIEWILRELLTFARNQNYKIVTIDQLLAINAYSND